MSSNPKFYSNISTKAWARRTQASGRAKHCEEGSLTDYTVVSLHIINRSQSNGEKAHSGLQPLPYVPSTSDTHPSNPEFQVLESIRMTWRTLKNTAKVAPWLIHQGSGAAPSTALDLRRKASALQRLQELFLKHSLHMHFLQRAAISNCSWGPSDIRDAEGFSVENTSCSVGKWQLQGFIAKTCARLVMQLHCDKGGFIFSPSLQWTASSGTFQLSLFDWNEGIKAPLGVPASPTRQKEKNCFACVCAYVHVYSMQEVHVRLFLNGFPTSLFETVSRWTWSQPGWAADLICLCLLAPASCHAWILHGCNEPSSGPPTEPSPRPKILLRKNAFYCC